MGALAKFDGVQIPHGHGLEASSERTTRSAGRALEGNEKNTREGSKVSLAEWSKALAPGASPQGRGLEPHRCQLKDMQEVRGQAT